jgi:glycosyltransferase involved in cell wall biosynthesis
MRCPTLAELPPPPTGKAGWPWTVDSRFLPPTRYDGSSWPRISIVTPSYNQGQFIEETIRSVLLQGYPDIEYFVIDGGSSDQSIEIIRKYERWLTYWTTEKDRGQAHAINKGFARATGQIGAYLNSDDYYCPEVFRYVGESNLRHQWHLLIGMSAHEYKPTFRWLRRSWWRSWWSSYFQPARPFLISFTSAYGISQESTFWQLEKFRRLTFDESFNFCLDVDWYCRIAPGSAILITSRRIGYFRYHPQSKSATLQSVAKSEIARITEQESLRIISKLDERRIKFAFWIRASYFLILKMLGRDREFLYFHP